MAHPAVASPVGHKGPPATTAQATRAWNTTNTGVTVARLAPRPVLQVAGHGPSRKLLRATEMAAPEVALSGVPPAVPPPAACLRPDALLLATVKQRRRQTLAAVGTSDVVGNAVSLTQVAPLED